MCLQHMLPGYVWFWLGKRPLPIKSGGNRSKLASQWAHPLMEQLTNGLWEGLLVWCQKGSGLTLVRVDVGRVKEELQKVMHSVTGYIIQPPSYRCCLPPANLVSSLNSDAQARNPSLAP